jgi:hypothetical protein
MRCYFMRDDHIEKVEFLSATDDIGRVAEALDLFQKKGMDNGATGFEVWDGPRFVYRFPERKP